MALLKARPTASRVPALLAAVCAAALALSQGASPAAAQGGGHLTQDEALRTAFPRAAAVERRTAYLDEAQVEQARRLAGDGVEIDARIVTFYEGVDAAGRSLGTAWFDAHRVRTLPEVLMIVVDPGGAIATIEVLRFSEPPEYAPAAGWLAQFHGRALDDELSLKRGIVAITGATLTAHAVADAARRVLALREVIGHGGTASR